MKSRICQHCKGRGHFIVEDDPELQEQCVACDGYGFRPDHGEAAQGLCPECGNWGLLRTMEGGKLISWACPTCKTEN